MTESTTNRAGVYELPDELVLLRRTVTDFMVNEVRPAEDGEDPDAWYLPDSKLKPLQTKARAMGLWCVASPEEYGGAGLGVFEQTLLAEETAKCRMGLYVAAAGAFGFDPPNVVFRAGTPSQIERYAVPSMEAGSKTFVAISEPSGGADPARSIQTTARREGDEYVLDGAKFWITGALQADWGIVFARTAPGREGISCFIVETSNPGFSAEEIPVIRSWSPAEVTLRGCRIPAENLLGPAGAGFAISQTWLQHSRITYAAACIGVAQHALELAADYAKVRNAFGGPLADKQAIQWMLADSEIELRAARLLTWQAAWRADLGESFKTDASAAKVFASETAFRVVDRCVQVLGGMGVAKQYPLERWFREMRIRRIGEGPSEVHRMVVAREVLR